MQSCAREDIHGKIVPQVYSSFILSRVEKSTMFDFYKFLELQKIINLLVLFLMYHSDIQRTDDVLKYEAITAMMMAHLTQ